MNQYTWKDSLAKLRTERSFTVDNYLGLKIPKINDFFREEKLDTAVIGLSGGIDSTIALALLLNAKSQPHSPIKKVVGMTIPFYTRGATNQAEVVEKVNKIHCFFEHEGYPFDLQIFEHYTDLISVIEEDMPSNDWALGQLLSALRTPMFYFEAARLQEQGFKSIVVGTTNRDEGGYIGFFGKASDAMVDLQVIADLHKSEIYQLATHYDIPAFINSTPPRGDVWDNKTDLEMIGAPYDFIEFHSLWLSKIGWVPVSGEDAEAVLYKENVEKIHKHNGHKYKVGMPCRFVDVMERKVRGGWQ